MLISSLPGANPLPPEHKIGVFVRFCPSEPLFSGISSTKSGFLCAFCLRNPRFRASRAQNRHFCVRNGDISLVLAPSEHKIEVFVRFCPPKPSFSGISSTKSAFLCQKRRYFPGFGPFRAQNRHFCALLLGTRPSATGTRRLATGTRPSATETRRLATGEWLISA